MSKSVKAIATLGVVAALGVAALPLSSFAEDTQEASKTMTVTATVNDTLSIDIAQPTIAFGAIATGEVHTKTGAVVDSNQQDTTITVRSNDSTGYTLTGTNPNMVIDGGTENIPFAVIADSGQATSAWNYKLESSVTSLVANSLKSAYAAMPTGNIVAKTNAVSAANTGDVYKVTAAVFADATQKTGDYSATVTFTAATNASFNAGA